MDKEHKNGKMEQCTRGVGKITNNMVKVHIQIKMENPKEVFGMKEKDKNRMIRIISLSVRMIMIIRIILIYIISLFNSTQHYLILFLS